MSRTQLMVLVCGGFGVVMVGCYSGTEIRPSELPRVAESGPSAEARVQRPSGVYAIVPRDGDVHVRGSSDGQTVIRRFTGPVHAWIEGERLLVRGRTSNTTRWYALDGSTEVEVRQFDAGLTAIAVIVTVAALAATGIAVGIAIADMDGGDEDDCGWGGGSACGGSGSDPVSDDDGWSWE